MCGYLVMCYISCIYEYYMFVVDVFILVFVCECFCKLFEFCFWVVVCRLGFLGLVLKLELFVNYYLFVFGIVVNEYGFRCKLLIVEEWFEWMMCVVWGFVFFCVVVDICVVLKMNVRLGFICCVVEFMYLVVFCGYEYFLFW